MGKAWSCKETTVIDLFSKEPGRFDYIELGKGVFQDRDFSTLSKNRRDAGAYAGYLFHILVSLVISYRQALLPSHPQPHCHH